MSEKKEWKTMEENKTDREKLGREFEEKYSDFLTVLKQMPKGTREEREQRWAYFRNYHLHDDFQMDLLEAYRPEALERLNSRMKKADKPLNAYEGMATYKEKTLDNLVFMEAVKETIRDFTGIKQDGSIYSFVASIGVKVRQKSGRAAAKNELEEWGVSDSEIPEKNLPGVIKLVKKAKDMYERDPDLGSPELVLDFILEEEGRHYTKKDVKLVRDIVLRGKSVSSSRPVGEEDGDTELIDMLEDESSGAAVEGDGQWFLETFCRHVEENWETIRAGIKLREKEYVRIFLTKDILKVLKLDGNGNPYPKEPAGDEGFYCGLEPCGETLYHKVFYEKYLLRAFIERPEDFYEVYVKLLRKDFDFSDKFIAQILGKDKATVSRGGRSYRNVMEAFYKYYLNSV